MISFHFGWLIAAFIAYYLFCLFHYLLSGDSFYGRKRWWNFWSWLG